MEDVFYGRKFKDHEISAVYVYDQPVEAEGLRLQMEEVEAVRWMDLKVCMEAVKKGSLPNCLYMDELELVQSFLEGI